MGFGSLNLLKSQSFCTIMLNSLTLDKVNCIKIFFICHPKVHTIREQCTIGALNVTGNF